MVAARGGARSLGFALSLASPGSLRCPSRSPACRSVCEGGGGHRGGGGRRSGRRETRGGRRRLRRAPGSHGRREAAGGAERWGSCPFGLPARPPRPSLLPPQAGALRGRGPGRPGGAALPGSHPPRPPQGRGALWAAPSRPAPGFVSAFGVWAGGGEPGTLAGPRSLAHRSVPRSRAHGALPGRLRSPSGPRTPGVGVRESKRLGVGAREGQSNFKVSQEVLFGASEVISPRVAILTQVVGRLPSNRLENSGSQT